MAMGSFLVGGGGGGVVRRARPRNENRGTSGNRRPPGRGRASSVVVRARRLCHWLQRCEHRRRPNPFFHSSPRSSLRLLCEPVPLDISQSDIVGIVPNISARPSGCQHAGSRPLPAGEQSASEPNKQTDRRTDGQLDHFRLRAAAHAHAARQGGSGAASARATSAERRPPTPLTSALLELTWLVLGSAARRYHERSSESDVRLDVFCLLRPAL